MKPAARRGGSRSASQSGAQLCLGQSAVPLGTLRHTRDGAREFSAFEYAPSWLVHPERFAVSPDLVLTAGTQLKRPAVAGESCFHLALADTEPDAWGRRVIQRAHAKARQADPGLPALTEFDYLAGVDDAARVGALRLRDAKGKWLRTPADGEPAVPPLLDLPKLFESSRAVERGEETAADLRYLQGRGTSLGGLRPKCTLIDADGALAIGKFPSLGDERSVTRGEVLALRLASRAGISTAVARLVLMHGTPITVVRRFDRTPAGARIPYLSAATLLQARRDEERAYTEVVDTLRSVGAEPAADARELWRRLVFNHLVTNVDDHLHNLALLHVGRGQWRLAPAFDLNPFPDKARESNTWLSETHGPVDSIRALLAHAAYFHLDGAAAHTIVREVHAAVSGWRELATSPEVGMTAREADDFAPAFHHAGMDEVRALDR